MGVFNQWFQFFLSEGVTISDIIGSSTITISSSTTTLNGIGVEVATTSVTFSPTAGIFATAFISGSSGLSFDLALRLEGDSSLTGDADVDVTPTAILTGIGTLVGSSSIAFGVTGNLGAVPSNIVGSSSITFSASAGSSSGNNIAGTISMGLTPSGPIYGTANTVGTSGIVFDGVARTTGDSFLTGASLLSMGGSAGASAEGYMSGLIEIEQSAQLNLSILVNVAASSDITFDSELDLLAEGLLLGTGRFRFIVGTEAAVLDFGMVHARELLWYDSNMTTRV